MAKILILAPSGFGKSTSIGAVPEYGLKGLKPEETYLISVTRKLLPFGGSLRQYPEATEGVESGRRFITNDATDIPKIVDALIEKKVKFNQLVLDDFNYLMQDYYMQNALEKGWDAPKIIGFRMGAIFDSFDRLAAAGKHVIVLAHGEEKLMPDGRVYLKLKTTGKMVDEYVTPEGKFEVALIGVSRFDGKEKKVIKEFITNETDKYCSAKSPIGMFPNIAIPNDLGLVVDCVNAYFN